MNKGFGLRLFAAMLLISVLFNSCKKDEVGTVETIMARGTWQLASVQLFNYIGSTNTSTDTLNTTCGRDQTLTFNIDNSITFTNFSCLEQSSTGRWELSEDKLTLKSGMVCKDTSGVNIINATPFANARIVNVGQFSLILETGDLSTFYRATDKRHIKRYGFIRF